MIKVWTAVAFAIFLGIAVVHPVLLAFPVVWVLLSAAFRLSTNRTDRRALDRRQRLLAQHDRDRKMTPESYRKTGPE